MPKLRKISGNETIKILCNKFNFEIAGRKGSHVRLSKKIEEGKIGTVIPVHSELKIGTLKNILKLANITEEEFSEYL